MNIRYPIYEGVYRILTVHFNQNASTFSFKRKCVFQEEFKRFD